MAAEIIHLADHRRADERMRMTLTEFAAYLAEAGSGALATAAPSWLEGPERAEWAQAVAASVPPMRRSGSSFSSS